MAKSEIASPIRRKRRVFTWDSVRITVGRMPRRRADFNRGRFRLREKFSRRFPQTNTNLGVKPVNWGAGRIGRLIWNRSTFSFRRSIRTTHINRKRPESSLRVAQRVETTPAVGDQKFLMIGGLYATLQRTLSQLSVSPTGPANPVRFKRDSIPLQLFRSRRTKQR